MGYRTLHSVTDNLTNIESVSMFKHDTTLSEILNVTSHKSYQPIGKMELNIQGILKFVAKMRTTINSVNLNDLKIERVSSFNPLLAKHFNMEMCYGIGD